MSESLNFNLKLYRERLVDKYSKSPVETRFDPQKNGIESQRKTPIKRDQANAPSLNNLVNKLQEYSSKKAKQNDSFLFKSGKSNQNSSPSKINGLHQKPRIQSISSLSPPPQQNNLQFPAKGHQYSITQFSGIMSPQKSSFISPTHFSQITDRYEQQESFTDISSLIPLHEIVNMRTKLENANINVASITPTYLTEFIKLANTIQSQLKPNKRQG
ncbi:unnamed protein product (macronuclear) [Paramecium tetraurelia]|uniref:Uncharacterized protein n=1 Tax=Paramecium tetraurelia TaxID=5888 RepID=A0BUB4_PARTE|nr:uncharacterized protein GSPATT00032363001 [Paramecium tetraurelia]CAK62131.1 unnamed protein product [Paramecium tetraurelia]|eukprot:XP_001429529.1 hypothetical protein (macronuclear) [Paramecium tetraurelia strain d4-2]